MSPGQDKAEASQPRGPRPPPGHALLWAVAWAAQGAGLCSWPLRTLSLQELFKAFARHLSHSLTQNPCPRRGGECEQHRPGGTRGGSTGRGLALTPSPHP